MAVFLVIAGMAASPRFFPANPSGIVENTRSSDKASLIASAQGAQIDSAATLQVQSDPYLSSANNGQLGSIGALAVADVFYNQGAIKDGAPLGQGSASLSSAVTLQSTANLPNFNKDFISPSSGKNLGTLSGNNGVDFIGSCGTPVAAAADGVVIQDPNIQNAAGGWNDGYGNFVLIQHSFGNGVETRYAYLAETTVNIGDYVKQGQQIGVLGSSGAAAGCDLLFEVSGAKNPFIKN